MAYAVSRAGSRLPWLLLAAFFAGAGLVLLWPGTAEAQDSGDVYYSKVEAACIHPEKGPNHEKCVCAVLRIQDAEYYQDFVWQGGDTDGPEVYPSGLRYDGKGDPATLEFQRDKEFKSQCSLTYFREDLRRGWWFGVFVALGLFTMSVAWAGYVYMQESAAAAERAQSRAIVFRVMAGLAIVVMAYFLWAIFSDMFLDLGDKTIWTPDVEDRIGRPDW